MFNWYKRLDAKLKERLAGVDLFKLYPNYFISKVPFQIAAYLIIILSFGVWAGSGFNLAHVNISCPSTNPTPCLNPVYECPRVDHLRQTSDNPEVFNYPGNITFYDGVKCQVVPRWICEQVPCNKEYLMPGESYGLQSNPYKIVIAFDIMFILLAFGVNHLLYQRKRIQWEDRQN